MAARYASALFDLAQSDKNIGAVEKDINRLDSLLKGSDDLMRLVRSPVFSADDQQAAIGTVLTKAKVTGTVGNFVRVVAGNRRLFVLPEMIRAFKTKLSESRGETEAQVTVAQKLSADQIKQLKVDEEKAKKGVQKLVDNVAKQGLKEDLNKINPKSQKMEAEKVSMKR